MKAVVLVGGEGTRLRPLTVTVPKPLLSLVDRPILDHVLDHLVAHGVREVIMSSPYLEDTFDSFIEARGGEPAIRWITEPEPLGTGGAIVSALDQLGDEPFFAVNGDILTDLDLTAMLESHRERGAVATIALQHVEDARAFGLVVTAPTGRVTEFREKPPDPIAGDINAGTYVLEPSALLAWPAETYIWIEGEIFPALIRDGAAVYGFDAAAYWLDLGTPQQYLRAHVDLLAGRVRDISYDAPWLGPGASVDPAAHVGRWVVIGEGARVGPGAVVDEVRACGAGAVVADSVLGEGAEVPPGATLEAVRLGPGEQAS